MQNEKRQSMLQRKPVGGQQPQAPAPPSQTTPPPPGQILTGRQEHCSHLLILLFV